MSGEPLNMQALLATLEEEDGPPTGLPSVQQVRRRSVWRRGCEHSTIKVGWMATRVGEPRA